MFMLILFYGRRVIFVWICEWVVDFICYFRYVGDFLC